MSANIRFVGLVKSTTQLESDKFAGRIGWNSTLSRYVVYYNSTQYATMARNDVLETFSAGINDSTIPANRIVYSGSGGRLSGAEYCTIDPTNGSMSIAGTMTSRDVIVRNPSGTSQSIGYLHSTSGNSRLITRFDEATDSFDTVTRNDDGTPRNTALRIPRATASAVNAGGSGGQPWNFTGAVWTGGSPRISAAGRFDATSLYNSAWAGGGVRPLLTDNAGMGYATDAATFRTTISAQPRSEWLDAFDSLTNASLGLSGFYRRNANDTLGLAYPKTGWTAATGTATRSTFVTGSVTLSVLAEHVKALIDDLISHGLIGA